MVCRAWISFQPFHILVRGSIELMAKTDLCKDCGSLLSARLIINIGHSYPLRISGTTVQRYLVDPNTY